MIANKYDENSIKTLNYRDACRESLGMYIGDNSSSGMQHLLTEIVANAMDEAAAGYGNVITVTIETALNRATVTDHGRGIPFHKNKEGKYAIVEMCTNLHSGGKFTGQGNYKSSLGLNGVGATVTNALSQYFNIEVDRDGEHCSFTVVNGRYDEPKITKTGAKISGSTVSFIPDGAVFKDVKWNVKAIADELQLHALLNNNITFILRVIDEKGNAAEQKWCYKNGIQDMLALKTTEYKTVTDPVFYSTTVSADSGESCDVSFGFVYTDRAAEEIWSFVNGGYTPNNGTHVTGWKSAFTSFVNKAAKEAEVIKDKNFSGDIVRKGLVLVLSIKMTERPLFAEQTKRTLNSPSARKFCSQAVGSMEISGKIMTQILNKIAVEQKAEDAAQRRREAQEKIARGGHNMNSLRDLPEKLADASDFTDAEIFFTEGELNCPYNVFH